MGKKREKGEKRRKSGESSRPCAGGKTHSLICFSAKYLPEGRSQKYSPEVALAEGFSCLFRVVE